MAFSDEMIRALVKTGEATASPAAERHLADVLIQRRDKIGAAYLIAVNPLVDFSLSSDGRLSFANAAVAAGVAAEPTGGYRVTLGPVRQRHGLAERHRRRRGRRLPHAGRGAGSTAVPRGSFVCVRVAPVRPALRDMGPVRAYFRRAAGSWALVGLDRSGM